jgi:hypothetical protein
MWIEVGEAAATGNLAAAAAMVLVGVLAYTLDGKWQNPNEPKCSQQYNADIQTCQNRFPSNSSKRSACFNHAMVRYVQCMKGLPLPPLQPTS